MTLGLLVFGVWTIVLIVTNFVYPHIIEFPVLFSAFNLQFLMGMLAAYLLKRQNKFIPSYFLSLGIVSVTIAIFCELSGIMNGFNETARVVYGLAFTLLLIGAVQKERKIDFNIPNIALFLGRSSYSIYLTHLIIGGIVFKLFMITNLINILPIPLSAFLVVFFAIIGGCILSHYVEMPLTKKIRKRIFE